MDALITLLAQVPTEAASETSRALEVQNVWDFVVKGGLMMIPIGLCSFVALTVIVERLTSLRRGRVMPAAFLPGLKTVLQDDPGDRASALAYCRNNASPIARIFAAGIKKLGSPQEIVEKHIADAGEREMLRLRKFVRVLAVIASVAPLMGLLGTIFGMITAFQTVALSGEALGKTELLAGGIYEAMITTAAGLCVAIPVLICYHWIVAKADRLVMDMDQLTVEFIEEFVEGDLEEEPSPGKAGDARGAKKAKTQPDQEDLPAGAVPGVQMK